MKSTAPMRKLYSYFNIVHSRPKTSKMGKIWLFNCTSSEGAGGKLSFQPNQPGGKFFWIITKHSAKKKNQLNKTFLFCCIGLLEDHVLTQFDCISRVSTTSKKWKYIWLFYSLMYDPEISFLSGAEVPSLPHVTHQIISIFSSLLTKSAEKCQIQYRHQIQSI